jgi:two-component system sensor histidine kinase TctE
MALLAILLVGYGIRGGLKPVEQLRALVAARPPRDLSPLPTETVPEELQSLIEALNRQFELLSASLSGQERFLADAAHQLKTPLSALQTQLELAAEDGDAPTRQRRLFEMAELTRRTSHLAHQLLALARAEPSAGVYAQRQNVPLNRLAEGIARSHLDAAIERDIDLGFDLAGGEVDGVPWLLQELLGNLVTNAIAYTPSGGHVTVRCGQRDGHPFLEVEDDGPGIPPELRERVFERFFRPAGGAGNGCGLGLAIVRDIAAGHGATVVLDSGSGGRGLRVTVLFP